MKIENLFLTLLFSLNFAYAETPRYMYNYCDLKININGSVDVDTSKWNKNTLPSGHDVYTPILNRVDGKGKPILNPNGTPQFCESVIEVAKNPDNSILAVKIEYNRSQGHSSMYRFRENVFAVYRDAESGKVDPSDEWEITARANREICSCLEKERAKNNGVKVTKDSNEEIQRREANETATEKEARLKTEKAKWETRSKTPSAAISQCKSLLDNYNTNALSDSERSIFPELLSKLTENKEKTEKLSTEQDEFNEIDVCGRFSEYDRPDETPIPMQLTNPAESISK